ncbi:MAG TPA: type IV pilus modification protein PilV [Steroidobacteraceae bacterium]|nr:type IV pilus modification protein PilV [Steroidobacteraceae bacterium]
MTAILEVTHAARLGPVVPARPRSWRRPRWVGTGIRPRASRGLSLVEALVALVVLSVGLLGIAALYGESLLSVRTALQRSQAVLLASDLAERIRANRGGGPAYDDAVSGPGALTTACRQGGGGCSPELMARHDKAEWTAAVKAALPSGTGAVEVGGPTHGTYTITIRWTEPAMGQQVYALGFQP